MIYQIKIDQRSLMFIKHVLAQRPFAEVAKLIEQIEQQQNEQDASNAIPIENVRFE